jgi:hypothetical protein
VYNFLPVTSVLTKIRACAGAVDGLGGHVGRPADAHVRARGVPPQVLAARRPQPRLDLLVGRHRRPRLDAPDGRVDVADHAAPGVHASPMPMRVASVLGASAAMAGSECVITVRPASAGRSRAISSVVVPERHGRARLDVPHRHGGLDLP